MTIGDKQNAPTLSVVLANYNHAATLPAAIKGILSQTRPPDEFLIVDDASTDNSVEIVKAYAKQHPCICLEQHEQNQGVHATYRDLFKMARGDYIHPLAADDQRYPQFFERAMELAEQHPLAGLIMGDTVIVDEEDQETGLVSIRRWREPTFASPQRYLSDYLNVEPPSHSLIVSTIIRREAFAEVGWYRTELGPWGDTFSLHAIALKHGACYLPERFAKWRRVPTSYSQRVTRDPRQTLDVVNRAAHLMRSPELRDRFPESFVRSWSKRYRWQAIRDYWRGDYAGELPSDASTWKRYAYRLPRTASALALLFHRTDLSESA